MRLIVVDDYDQLSRKAAELIQGQIEDKPSSVLGLATGSTPVGTYEALIAIHKNENLSFDQVTTFNLDEYYGLDEAHDQSYHSFMQTNLFSHINVKPEATHIPSGQPEDVDVHCKVYEERIAMAGGIDLQLLGLGRNGHIGFNEPGTRFEERTRLVDLTQDTIDANARFFESEADVPKQAISMGIKTIMKAKEVLLLVSGEAKADTVRRMIYGPVTKDLPASVLQLHPNVTIVMDKAAASRLENRGIA